MYALMISTFVRRELQLSFYANKTTCPVHGIPCREGECSIELYLQCFENPETVTSTVESEHDKTNTMTCTAHELCYQPWHPQSQVRLRCPSILVYPHTRLVMS